MGGWGEGGDRGLKKKRGVYTFEQCCKGEKEIEERERESVCVYLCV